jgi:tetratricopeptide (TPR) repeat protein
MRAWSFAIAVALAASSLAARAQDGSLEDAKRYAAEAKVHYDLGEYEAAADAYQKVYRIKPLPALLYNIAQSYRQAAQYEKAKRFYTTYLREAKSSNSPLLADARRALREVDELLAKERKTRESPPIGVARTEAPLSPSTARPASATAPPVRSASPAVASHPLAAQPAAARPVETVPSAAIATSVPPQARRASRPLTWVAAGTAGAALALGGYYGVKTISSRSTDDAKRANTLYAIGGGLAVLSGAFFLLEW